MKNRQNFMYYTHSLYSTFLTYGLRSVLRYVRKNVKVYKKIFSSLTLTIYHRQPTLLVKSDEIPKRN